MLTSHLCTEGDQNLGDDLVDDAKIRPSDPNDCPPSTFKIALPTLLGLDALVDFVDRVPVFDTTVELDGNLQVGQCNIDEVGVAGYVDLFLSGHVGDARTQQCEQDKGLARRLTSSVCAVNDPSSPLASDGVEWGVGQGLVKFSARLLLTDARLILTETIELARPGQGCTCDGKTVPVGQQSRAINNNSRWCRDAEAQVLH